VQDFKFAIELTISEEQKIGGINTLLICISARERVTHAETLLIYTCIKLFSKGIKGHCMLAITNVDEFEERTDYEEWLLKARSNPKFQDIVNACSGIVFPISNRKGADWAASARHNILEAIAQQDRIPLANFGSNLELIKLIQVISSMFHVCAFVHVNNE